MNPRQAQEAGGVRMVQNTLLFSPREVSMKAPKK